MNHVVRGPRRARLRAARTVAAVIAAVTLSTPAAASANGPTNTQKALAYARCMRSHGVPKYPDPSSSNEMPNGLPKVSLQQLGVSLSQFQAAQRECRHLLPNGGSGPSQSASRQMLRTMINFAGCMRSHGVSNWPDPTASTPAMVALGAPPYMFHLDGLPGLDGRSFSPRITHAMNECQHLTGSQVPYSG